MDYRVDSTTNLVGQDKHYFRTDEFGVPILDQGTLTQPLRWAGEERDRGTKLTNLRARMYDRQLGRLLQRDPWSGAMGEPQSLNRYSYVGNNRVTFADPSGLDKDERLRGSAGA